MGFQDILNSAFNTANTVVTGVGGVIKNIADIEGAGDEYGVVYSYPTTQQATQTTTSTGLSTKTIITYAIVGMSALVGAKLVFSFVGIK